MPRAKTKTNEPQAAEPIAWVSAIKGFDANLRCHGEFQFAVGGEYRHEGPVKCCEGGFHAITDHPLAVFDYYGPAGSRFCRVQLGGVTHSDDGVKTAAEILRVGEEIGITDLVNDAIACPARCGAKRPLRHRVGGLRDRWAGRDRARSLVRLRQRQARPRWRERFVMWRLLASRTARQVADLLDRDPDGWSDEYNGLGKRYRIHHCSGLSLWVANHAYGLHVEGAGEGRWLDQGYLSTLSISPDHNLIWRAYARWNRSHPWREENRVKDRIAAAHAELSAAPQWTSWESRALDTLAELSAFLAKFDGYRTVYASELAAALKSDVDGLITEGASLRLRAQLAASVAIVEGPQ